MSGQLYLVSSTPALTLLLLLLPVSIIVGTAAQDYTVPAFQTAFQTDAIDDVRYQTASTPDRPVSSSRSVSTLPVTQTHSTPTTTTTTTTTHPTTTTAPIAILYRKECSQLLLVTGVLIITCFILLVSTLLLACRVCQLNRRMNSLNNNGNMISSANFCVGTAKKDQLDIEANETTVLMADLTETQDGMKNGDAKEDGEKAKKDEEKGGEKEAGDTAPSGETLAEPATPEEKSPSPKPQEGETDSQSASAEAATDKAKDLP